MTKRIACQHIRELFTLTILLTRYEEFIIGKTIRDAILRYLDTGRKVPVHLKLITKCTILCLDLMSNVSFDDTVSVILIRALI